MNSGATHGQGESDVINKKASVTRNNPSINVNSFSGVDDSTLQLDTIGPAKQNAPSSTKNRGLHQG